MTLSKKSVALQLQSRDFAFLRGLFESRIMTIAHIGAIYFDGKAEYAKRRVRQIKAEGLVGERKRNANEKSVLFLTRKGFSVLRAGGHIEDYPSLGGDSFEARAAVSELKIRHEIEVMDVKSAFHRALAKSEKYLIQKFHTWPRLYEFKVARHGYNGDDTMRPDGFITIYEKEEGAKGYAHDFFVEVDRSTEALHVLIDKATRYLEFYRSGGFAVLNGGTATDFTDYPFRVLIVLKSAERRNNLAERLLQNTPPILTHTWLTTLAEATADPLGSIWVLPKDYHEATKETAFDASKQTRSLAYRRQEERERLVERKIKKVRLLLE